LFFIGRNRSSCTRGIGLPRYGQTTRGRWQHEFRGKVKRIMADWKNIGNYAGSALWVASIALWLKILIKRINGQPPLRLVEQQPPSWPVPPVCATFLVAILLPSFLSNLLERLAGPIDSPSTAAIQWRIVFSLVQMVTIVALLRVAGPLRKEDFGCNLSGWRPDVLVGTGGFLASIIPVYLVTTLQQFLEWRGPDDKHVFFKILETNDGNGILFWIVVSVVVVGPLAEELLYRVLLQGCVQSQMALWPAIVFSSAIFCLVHQPTDMLPLVPLALILGYIYYRRRSYLAVVVAHALFNAMNIALALLRT
jgi:membrane protease YdiL (CAAX protease family)